MIGTKLSQEIKKAAGEMSMREFWKYLQDLSEKEDLGLNFDEVEVCIAFALRLVAKMKSDLESGEWYGYEFKALATLEDIDCEEEDLIRVNVYGYPEAIKDNEELMGLVGLDDVLGKEPDRDIYFYEVEVYAGDNAYLSNVCIRGVREPSVEEAQAFFDECGDTVRVHQLWEISSEEAGLAFDLDDVDEWPVFGFATDEQEEK